jgi:hypothetical protein
MAQPSPSQSPTASSTETAAVDANGADRRRTPRRRLRDRIASLDSTKNPALRGRYELKNLMLLVDDDLRQTALTLGTVEKYLTESMSLLEDPTLDREALAAHADHEDVLDRIDDLVENLVHLRRRMKSIAIAMSPPGSSSSPPAGADS